MQEISTMFCALLRRRNSGAFKASQWPAHFGSERCPTMQRHKDTLAEFEKDRAETGQAVHPHCKILKMQNSAFSILNQPNPSILKTHFFTFQWKSEKTRWNYSPVNLVLKNSTTSNSNFSTKSSILQAPPLAENFPDTHESHLDEFVVIENVPAEHAVHV